MITPPAWRKHGVTTKRLPTNYPVGSVENPGIAIPDDLGHGDLRTEFVQSSSQLPKSVLPLLRFLRVLGDALAHAGTDLIRGVRQGIPTPTSPTLIFHREALEGRILNVP